MSQQEPRVYRIVAHRIRELVRQETIPPGMRLPPERELAARLNVSRSSLRGGMIALELAGEIEVRGRSGAYLTSTAPPHEPSVTRTPVTAADVLAARRLFEPELAAMAARFAGEETIGEILASLPAIEHNGANAPVDGVPHQNFYRAMARAAGNSAFAGVMDYLMGQHCSLRQVLKIKCQNDGFRLAMLADHHRIAYAIACREPVTARDAVRTHLARITKAVARSS